MGLICADLASEALLSREQDERLRFAAGGLFLLSMAIQSGAAWLLQGQRFRPLRFVGLVAVCVIGSFFCGLIVGAIADRWFTQVAHILM